MAKKIRVLSVGLNFTRSVGKSVTKGVKSVTSAVEDGVLWMMEQFVGKVQDLVPSTTLEDLMNGTLGQDSHLGGPPASHPDTEKIKKAYIDAWERSYDTYRRQHESNISLDRYEKLPWPMYKAQNYKSGSPWYKSGMKINYKTHSLSTGYLKSSIESAFRRGGDRHLTVDNFFARAGLQWHPDAYDSDYKEWMEIVEGSEHMQDLHVYDGIFVNFSDEDWRTIGTLILTSWRNGPIEDLRRIIEDFKLEL